MFGAPAVCEYIEFEATSTHKAATCTEHPHLESSVTPVTCQHEEFLSRFSRTAFGALTVSDCTEFDSTTTHKAANITELPRLKSSVTPVTWQYEKLLCGLDRTVNLCPVCFLLSELPVRSFSDWHLCYVTTWITAISAANVIVEHEMSRLSHIPTCQSTESRASKRGCVTSHCQSKAYNSGKIRCKRFAQTRPNPIEERVNSFGGDDTNYSTLRRYLFLRHRGAVEVVIALVSQNSYQCTVLDATLLSGVTQFFFFALLPVLVPLSSSFASQSANCQYVHFSSGISVM